MNAISNKWPAILRIVGIGLLLAGIQSWGFNQQTAPLIAAADTQLTLLRQEMPDNRLANESLRSLQDYWQSADDDLVKRQVLELRDTVLQRFGTDPAAAAREFARVVASFESRSIADQEVLTALQKNVTDLEAMYTDHAGAAIMAVSRPAWYLQPTASFLNNNRSRNRAMAFNHALYLMHVRDTDAAVEILDDLRRDTDASPQTDHLVSKALFVLSRLQYQAFRLEQDQAYFRESLQYAQQSVRSNADNALAKLFLDYLLSVDQQATEVDTSPLEGEGSGEGEGERGAIATDAGEF